MRRYSPLLRRGVDSQLVDAFLQEVDAVCVKFGFTIGCDYDGTLCVNRRDDLPFESQELAGAEDYVSVEGGEGVSVYPVHEYAPPPKYVAPAIEPEGKSLVAAKYPTLLRGDDHEDK